MTIEDGSTGTGQGVVTATTAAEEEEEKDWNNTGYTYEEYTEYINNLIEGNTTYGVNGASSTASSTSTVSDNDYSSLANSMAGIFGMPYQFSEIVDPPMDKNTSDANSKIGRKYNQKIFSIAPVLFLCPGEPVFMQGYGKDQKASLANKLVSSKILGDDDDDGSDYDEGRFYSFASNFPEYKKYANVALRALARFMGIQDMQVPVPGTAAETVTLGNIDVEKFMNNSFTKLFGSQCVVPFFLDANTSVEETYGNDTSESIVSQTANGFSDTAREVQFLMGSSDYGGVLDSIGSGLTNITENLASALGDVADLFNDNSVMSRVTNELTTIVSGGKIVFPEIWSGSSYSNGGYSVTIKLRSPDPDPVSIFLNIYMPIILLVSMAAPRQLGNSSNSYKSPFLVRATYKSIFNCDLGIISSLNISRGGEDKWNVLGMPTSADVSVEIKDLYSTMFVSKRMGLISNTAQLDYLSTLAGLDLNEYEPTRLVKLWLQILGDTPRDWANDLWGGIKSTLNRKASAFMNSFSLMDTRYLS